MPAALLLGFFFFLLLSPCLVACFDDTASESFLSGERWRLPRSFGERPRPLNATAPDNVVAETFPIRSFPKGIRQRRLLVRDAASGPRLSIQHLREAAAALAPLTDHSTALELARPVAVACAESAPARQSSALRSAWVQSAAASALLSAENHRAWTLWADTLCAERVVPVQPIHLLAEFRHNPAPNQRPASPPQPAELAA